MGNDHGLVTPMRLHRSDSDMNRPNWGILVVYDEEDVKNLLTFSTLIKSILPNDSAASFLLYTEIA